MMLNRVFILEDVTTGASGKNVNLCLRELVYGQHPPERTLPGAEHWRKQVTRVGLQSVGFLWTWAYLPSVGSGSLSLNWQSGSNWL